MRDHQFLLRQEFRELLRRLSEVGRRISRVAHHRGNGVTTYDHVGSPGDLAEWTRLKVAVKAAQARVRVHKALVHRSGVTA